MNSYNEYEFFIYIIFIILMKNTDTSKEISKNLDECIEIGQNIINTFEENSEVFNHNKKTIEEITYLNTMSKIHLQRMHSVWWRIYYYFKPTY